MLKHCIVLCACLYVLINQNFSFKVSMILLFLIFTLYISIVIDNSVMVISGILELNIIGKQCFLLNIKAGKWIIIF